MSTETHSIQPYANPYYDIDITQGEATELGCSAIWIEQGDGPAIVVPTSAVPDLCAAIDTLTGNPYRARIEAEVIERLTQKAESAADKNWAGGSEETAEEYESTARWLRSQQASDATEDAR